MSFAMSKVGVEIGILIIAIIIGIPVFILLITNLKVGFYLILICSFFIAYLQRISNGLVDVIILELMMYLVFTGLIIKEIRTHSNSRQNSNYLKNPIIGSLILWTVYIHLQLFNPNSSSIIGKLIAIRFSWYNLLGFIIALQVFDSLHEIKIFLKIILGLALLAAFYGISQKYIGLTPYDYEWLFSSPERMSLGVIWGQVRAWSFMNDPANFGLLMAFSGILCLTLTLGPYSISRKIILGVSGLLMFIAMVASGTRTAFVMVTAGFGIFAVLTLNSLRTIFFSLFIFLVFLAIYFGPFYSAPVQRIRSAFKGNEDASMNVRSENKKRIQPYIYSHPIGGGPGTTGEVGKKLAQGHPLSGFPPDSGSLKIALETGYIGLMILFWLYYKVSSQGTKFYFNAKNQEIKIFYAAILSSFIALCTADLTQLATSMRPFDFFIFSYFAAIIKLDQFDKESS